MSTPDLIRHLASDLTPRPAIPIAARLAVMTAAASLLCLTLILTLFSRSPHLVGGPTMSVVVTAVAGMALALGAFWMMLQLVYPEGRPQSRWLIVPAMVLLLGLGFEISQMPRAEWLQRMVGTTPLLCFFSVLLLSLPIMFAALLVLRQGASSRPGLSGAMAGLLAGAITMVLYTIHCPEDSLLYVTAWHVSAIVLLAGTGALLGNHWLRW
jgi:hypothetical protein